MLTWVLKVILFVFSAVEVLKAETIYSSHVALAPESGRVACKGVIF
jgi:hypothetical protein